MNEAASCPNTRGSLFGVSCLVATAIFCLSTTLTVRPSLARDRNPAVIVAINDVYRLNGVNSGRDGGMPRVRTLRDTLEKSHPDLLLLHAGDFLSPSFLGRTFKGAQMIDLMNVMDGNPAHGSHDRRMFVAFGNHEFDDTHCSRDGPLPGLVAASEFTWLASNLDFANCELLQPLAEAATIADTRTMQVGGLKIGIYGLTLSAPNYAEIVSDPQTVSCERVSALRASGVDVVVALTHLPWQVDLRLLGLDPAGEPLAAGDKVCADAPDLVVGGHDHRSMALPNAAPRLFKADSDAQTAWVIELTKIDGAIRIAARLENLDRLRRPDPLAKRLADQWQLRHDERFCALDCLGKTKTELKQCLRMIGDGACLKEELMQSRSLIETEEIANRSFETGFGNWVADRVRAVGKADVAFLNSGAIRLNQNIAKGMMVTRRHLEEMFPFKNKLVVRNVTGADLWKAMQWSVKQRGEGAWAHFSGMAVKLRGADGKQEVERILIRRTNGDVVDIGPASDDVFSLASLSFVLANGDKHGFKLCPETDDVWACKDSLEANPSWPDTKLGEDLSEFVRINLRQAGQASGPVFATDGRLCDPRQAPCLIDSWQ